MTTNKTCKTTTACANDGSTSSWSGGGACTATAPGTRISFADMTEAGAYVCNWSGHLLRVNAKAFSSDGTPCFSFASPTSLTLTYLSENADCSIEEARAMAAGFGVNTTF